MTVSPARESAVPAAAQHSFTLMPRPGERIHELFRRASALADGLEARVLKQTVFGSCAAHPDALECVEAMQARDRWPVTWVEGADCAGGPIAGVQVQAVSGAPVHTLWSEGRPVGAWFDDADGRHAYLGDIRPAHAALPEPQQAEQAYHAMNRALAHADLAFADVVRTWLFIDRILDWYPDFNRARDRFLAGCGVPGATAPASTGIGCANPHWTALVAEAYAFRPAPGIAGPAPIASPLQCPAPRYGSAFSRAVEVPRGGRRCVFVSGTASIEPGGATAHPGDTWCQILLTLDVVRALLGERGLGMDSVTRAVAYFRHAEQAFLMGRARDEGLLPAAPVVVVRADICRDDLLFEIEVDAIG